MDVRSRSWLPRFREQSGGNSDLIKSHLAEALGSSSVAEAVKSQILVDGATSKSNPGFANYWAAKIKYWVSLLLIDAVHVCALPEINTGGDTASLRCCSKLSPCIFSQHSLVLH